MPDKQKLDHRVSLTRQMFRRALTELLSEKPLSNITVKELCLRAQVNRGTFYAHFQDIYDLMEKIEEELLEQLQAALGSSPYAGQQDPYAIYGAVFDFFQNNKDMCAFLLGPNSDQRFMNQLLSLGRETCSKLYVTQYPSATTRQIERFYAFVSAGVMGLLRCWMEEGMVTPLPVIARSMQAMIQKGEGYLAGEE